ncbi:MAG TPA: hypothetical protein H9903_09380 [Candidatus Aquabacterium excrementipullorum]|nr:hypothetical protein [Candidatus Aquabacterium excrementipullorum]
MTFSRTCSRSLIQGGVLALLSAALGAVPAWSQTKPAASPAALTATAPAPSPVKLAPMRTAREGHTATVLPDGTVMIAGGTGADGHAIRSVEIYDPARNTWTAAEAMNTARARHTATLLNDGRVLFTGGIDETTYLDHAEVFDPRANTWFHVPALPDVRRANHTASLLPDGKVLVAGGIGFPAEEDLEDTLTFDTTEIFDPATETWSHGPTMAVGRQMHTATRLTDGSVLFVGGLSDAGGNSSAERYDPRARRFIPAGALTSVRWLHSASVLPQGKDAGQVLVAGGYDASGSMAGAELYDPAANAWRPGPAMTSAHHNHTATVLRSGAVLVSGGIGKATSPPPAQLYDPAAGTWAAVPAVKAERYNHTSTLLPNGSLLVVGGSDQQGVLATAELYPSGLLKAGKAP